MITGSEQGVISCGSEREGRGERERGEDEEGRWDGCQNGVNDSPCFLKRGVAFSKARQLEGDLFHRAWATAVT